MSRVQTKLSEITPIRPTAMDAHPKRPWVAASAENGVIRIFDYMYNQLVHQFSLADLELVEKNAQLLQAMAEKDPTYKGPRKPETKNNKKAIGDIKIIKFVDQDIRFNKFRHEKGKADVSWALEEKAMSSFAADWPHLLIVCGQNRVFYLDYVSYALKEIDVAAFDNREVTCMEAFALEDFVAFGCTDGAVRLWHVLTGAVTKLATNSSKPIVGLFSHYTEIGSYLTAVTEDGIFSKWRIHSHTEPSVEIKESKGNFDVFDITFDSTEHTLMLLTDKGIVVRDYYSNKEMSRHRIASATKQSFVSIAHFPHTKFVGSPTLALAKDGKTLSLISTKKGASSSTSRIPMSSSPLNADAEFTPILDVSDFPKGDKDSKTKFQYFSLHPTNACLVFIATTNGLVLATVDQYATPQFALVRAEPPPMSASSAPSLVPPSGPPRISSKSSSNSLQMASTPPPTPASKIYFVNDSQVWTIPSAAGHERSATYSFPSPLISLPSGTGEDAKIAMSPSGQYLSILYEKLGKYEIYSTDTKKVIDTGSRVLALVWCLSKEGPKTVKLKEAVLPGMEPPLSARSSAQDVFAFIEGPLPVASSSVITVGGSLSASPSNSSIPSSAATSVPTSSSKKTKGEVGPTSRTVTLNVKKVGGASHEIISTFETTLTATPKLFTGPILAVDVKFEPSLNSASISQAASNLQFFSWAGERIGTNMPTPMSVEWDMDSLKYCLFTYESHFCVFSIQPRFTLLAKVSDFMLSSLWYNGCLFYTTRTDIKCFFASSFDSRESVLSATPTDAFTSALLGKSQQPVENLHGCSIVEVANDKLVLLTHEHRVVSILIDNPLTQVYILAHAGKVSASVQLANQSVPEKYHLALAKFLEARGRVDAAGCLSLAPHDKLQLYLRHGLLAEAMVVYTAMIKQCRVQMMREREAALDSDDPTAQIGQRTLQTKQLLATAAHRIAVSATAMGSISLVGKVWKRLAKIEPTAYRHLALFYAQNGFTNYLQDLYRKLCNEAHRNPAIREEIKFVTVHISDKLLSDSLLNASNSYAEYIVSLHETPEREAELLETWNARISTEIDPEAILAGTSGTSASFSTMMISTDKDKSRNTASPLIW